MYNIDEIKNKIICGDCLEVMKEIPDNSIDTIITDPPYGLNFMGKGWDNFGTDLQKYQEWTRRWAIEALRIAKPGATLLCFGGTRTWHRLACGLEDAGWIIKDTLMWVYGSGFPKATDISKQIDKRKGKIIENNSEFTEFSKQTDTTKHIKRYLKCKICGKLLYGQDICNCEWRKYKWQSKEAKLWNGWKSHGLKPAWEPIIMAMKPNEGSYAENALKWGVAGLNIDESRVGINQIKAHHAPKGTFAGGEERKSDTNYYNNLGRFPANLIHDNSEEVRECFPETNPSRKAMRGIQSKGYSAGIDWEKAGEETNTERGIDDNGGNASRFFKSILYYPKASKSERNKGCEGLEDVISHGHYAQDEWSRNNMGNTPDAVRQPVKNNHPTVKPLKLMEYLCILTKTPTGGIVLDPFAGSGTTCMAAKKIGRDFIGIEREADYCAIARARIKAIKPNLTLFENENNRRT